MNNKAITKRSEDFAKWYTDVVRAAHLADYSAVKGCIVIEPAGYAIWEMMQNILDKKFKELGHVNVQMPMLIPENLLKMETDLVEGFAPEVAWVTEGGCKHLNERFCIRPTSETLFCNYFSSHIRSYKDLPLLYNQWCNVLRWEKETRPFLRSREFLWQEGHTIHSNKKEAEEETKKMLDVYKWFHHEILAIPSIVGKKTEKEKFSGAEYTLTNEALMYNGVTLQCGTSHYFGQKFAKAYDIKFMNNNKEYEYGYQTSWGTTTRMIGALIMVHSDDLGLVLPPNIAPKKLVIIPIGKEEEVKEACLLYLDMFNKAGITAYIDDSSNSPGFKFADAEVKGIPLRMEIGNRDLSNGLVTFTRRDNLEKITCKKEEINPQMIDNILNNIQKSMYERALKRREELTYKASNLDDIKNILEKEQGFIYGAWCGNISCEEKIKEIRGCKSRCICEDDVNDSFCVACGNKAKHMVIWGVQY